MNADERAALRDTVTRLYRRRGDPRRPEMTEAQVWSELRDLGLLSIAVPTQRGGGGADLVDAGLVCEVRGASCDFGAYPETVGLAYGLAAAGVGADDLLEGVATAGWQLVPVAAPGPTDATDGAALVGTYVPVGAERTLAVWSGPGDASGGAQDAVGRWCDVDADGTSRELASTARRSTRQVTLASTTDGAPFDMDEQAWNRAQLAVEALRTAEIVGACRWLQRDARRYATERVQFGRPISQFQAVQHQLVDVLAWVDAAELLVRHALRRIDEGAGGPEVARAGAFVRDRAWACLHGSYIVLGGMGFIEEMPVNVYCRGILGVLAELGPVSPVEQRSADHVSAGGWLSQRR